MEPKTPPRRISRWLSRNGSCSPLVGSSASSPNSKKTALYLNTRWLTRTRPVTRPESTTVKDRRQFQKLPPSPPEAPPLAEARRRRFNPLHWSTRSTSPPPTTARSSISELIRSFGGIKLEKKNVKALSNKLEDVATTAAGPLSDFNGGESWSPIRRAWRRTSSSISDSPQSLPYPLESSPTPSSPTRFAPAVHVGQRGSDSSLGSSFVLLPPRTIEGRHTGSESFGNHMAKTNLSAVLLLNRRLLGGGKKDVGVGPETRIIPE